MKARVTVWSSDGLAYRGTLKVTGLKFAVAAGGGGDVSFTALASDMDAVNAWDSVAVVECEDGAGWTGVAAYAVRAPHRRPRTGKPQVEVRGITLLEQAAMETVLLPEYGGGTLPRGAGEERAVGWQGTAYIPGDDPAESWSGAYNTSRSSSTLPPEFPTGTGAKWISVTGSTDHSERKLFRATLDLTGTTGPQLLEVFLASDEPATLYVAGEPVVSSTFIEGHKSTATKEPASKAQMVVFPGAYAVAVDTATSITKGGDGVDPIIVAIGIVGDSGSVSSWPLVSDEADWVACRRDDEFPGDQAPGPTPGAVIDALHWEAIDRGASFGTLGYEPLGTVDSYGQPWPGIIVERQFRYGSDSYWSILSALAETGEVDVWGEWMNPGVQLRAASVQGVNRTGAVTLTTAHITTMSDQKTPAVGSWIAGLTHTGWVVRSGVGPRREAMVELGTARSQAVAVRIVDSALADDGRWDASARVVAKAGARPLLDYGPGDTISINYPGAPTSARVLSISAEAGEGGMLFDLELSEAGL
jgi:hypothetical protein